MSIFTTIDQEKIDLAKALIKDVYMADNRPWVVGYSGGKDSTAVVQLLFYALSEMNKEDLKKKVYVISSDTLIETPLIISSINRNLMLIQDKALELGLPIETHKVKPEIEKSFWSTVIGKGYPTPQQKFRWCTDRLKIDPANRFIYDKVSKYGEVVMVLGVRDSESVTRGEVMKSHTVEGKTLMRHSTLSNAFVFAPIRNFNTDDVWDYLLYTQSPWGSDNEKLHKLYRDSSSECPLMVDKDIKESAGSCGNSRFGCWTCTVVKKDKALIGFIESGSNWLVPLLEFRDWLVDIRGNREYRQKHRMNGQIYYMPVNTEDPEVDLSKYQIIEEEMLGDYLKENNIDLAHVEAFDILVKKSDGTLHQLGLGPFNLKGREIILRRLLETQSIVQNQNPENSNYELISVEELKYIRRLWLEEGDWEDRLPIIYRDVMGHDLDWEYDERPLFENDQVTDLELLAQEHGLSLPLLKKLISIEKDYSGYKIRKGLLDEIEKVLKQDWLHL